MKNQIPEVENALGKSAEKLRDANGKIANFLSLVTKKVYAQAHYDALTNIHNGILKLSDDIGKHAIENGLVSAIGEYIEWDVGKAIGLAADILDDVNAHKFADELRNKGK